MRLEHATTDRGYAMAALLVAMAVIAIVLGTTLPVFSTMARRERETELVFRGQQYARAVTLFQRKYGNALPPNLDVLLNERFLRKQYKDPITGDDFQLRGTRQSRTGAGRQRGAGTAAAGPRRTADVAAAAAAAGSRAAVSGRTRSTRGEAPGGILGVVSKSKETSLRLYQQSRQVQRVGVHRARR